jgi:hypothetical protein
VTAIFRTIAAAACLLAGLSSTAGAAYINATAGGSLRPGVYGRIEIGRAPPPPLIYNRPVVASRAIPAPGVKPVYLYVPPGQVRKWPKHCGKYQACNVPVYFVRMDNSPNRLGKWKSRSELGGSRDPGTGLNVLGGPPGFRD